MFSSVQFSHLVVSDSATPWIAACQASLSITNSWSLLQPMSIELVMPSSHLILCHPLLLLSPIPPSIRVFSSESTLRMRWPKFWSFSFSISPLMLGSCIFTIVISSWWVDPFIIIELSSFSPVTFFNLKSIFSNISATFLLFCFLFSWTIFPHTCTFSLCVSLELKWVSCREHIAGSCPPLFFF